jgi:hypothetical protein
MSNNGSNYRGNSQVGRRSFSMDFYEPVAANAAIFVALIVLDLFNKTNELIPAHATVGILITLATLALCRYNQIMLAWVFAAIPALFLVISFFMALSKNSYVLAAKDAISAGYGKLKKGAISVIDGVRYVANEAGELVEDTNEAVARGYESGRGQLAQVGSTIASYTGKSDAAKNEEWKAEYDGHIKDGKTPLNAAMATLGKYGSPPSVGYGADQLQILRDGTSTDTGSIIEGEFNYLCSGTAENPIPKQIAESCATISKMCANKYGESKKKCLDSGVSILDTPAICLGGLVTGAEPLSMKMRNVCLTCVASGYRDENYDVCKACVLESPAGTDIKTCVDARVAAATIAVKEDAASSVGAQVSDLTDAFANYATAF